MEFPVGMGFTQECHGNGKMKSVTVVRMGRQATAAGPVLARVWNMLSASLHLVDGYKMCA